MQRPGRSRSAIVVLAVAAVVGLQLTVLAPTARAGVCDVTSHTLTIDANATVTLSRSGQNITVNGTNCGTVTSVDTVNVHLGGQGDAGIVFDLSHGAFAPGFTDEEPGSDPNSS